MARGRKAVERNSELPAAPKDRELLDSILNEIIGYYKERDRIRSNIKGAMESLTHQDSKLRLDRKYATKLVNVRLNEYKSKAMVESLQTAIDDNGVLTGKKESAE